jgi:hypothetical protein
MYFGGCDAESCGGAHFLEEELRPILVAYDAADLQALRARAHASDRILLTDDALQVLGCGSTVVAHLPLR